MTDERTYRIEELSTSGWTLVDERYQGMDREKTKETLQWLNLHFEIHSGLFLFLLHYLFLSFSE